MYHILLKDKGVAGLYTWELIWLPRMSYIIIYIVIPFFIDKKQVSPNSMPATPIIYPIMLLILLFLNLEQKFIISYTIRCYYYLN